MPTFLNWPTALLAAGIAVPALLLLYFLKLRRQEMAVSSTLLWKKTVHDLQVNAPFQRLRRNLLLLLQLLLLLALLLALSRPIVKYAPGAGSLNVILIDRSASMSANDMDGKTRLEVAKKAARELVDTMEKDASAMVIAFDDSADILQTFTSDRNLLKKAIDSIEPTDRRSRLKMAYQLAEAKAMAFHPEQRVANTPKPEVWLYSDGRVLDRSELLLHRADLRYVRIGSDNPSNLGVVAFSARRNYEKPTEVEVFARIGNYGDEPVAATVQLTVDGEIPADGVRSGLKLGAVSDPKGSQRGVNFKLDLGKGAVLRVEVIAPGADALAADNSAQLVLPPPRAMRVLLVSAGNRPMEQLLLAAKLKEPAKTDAAGYEQRTRTDEEAQKLASDYDLVIFDRYKPRKLPPAGNFIYLASYPPDSKLRAAQINGADVVNKDEQVLDWDRAHPILRGYNIRFTADEALKLQTPVDAQTLVDGRQGPLIVLHRETRRTHLAIAIDLLTSDWPVLGSFPVFFDSAFRYMALGGDMEERQSHSPGATPRIPRYNIQQAGADIREIRIDGPKGFDSRALAVPAEGDFALPPLDRAGLYTLSPAIPQFERIAVSLLDDNESNIVPVDEQPGGSGEAVKVTMGAGRLELWWWIIAAGAIPLCLIEWWVYTRRVHL